MQQLVKPSHSVSLSFLRDVFILQESNVYPCTSMVTFEGKEEQQLEYVLSHQGHSFCFYEIPHLYLIEVDAA
jgi:hypothetical protein